MPLLVGKEVGPTGYGTMSTILSPSTFGHCELRVLTKLYRNDMEQPATIGRSVL